MCCNSFRLELEKAAQNETSPFQFSSQQYSAELLQNLNRLFADECLCDVAVRVHADRLIRAHRCILSSGSPYFRAMLTGGLRETSSDIIDLQAIAAPHIIETLIAFMYTGKISVSSCIVEDLLEAADLLQLHHVVDACCQFLSQQLHESNCIGIYMFADAHSCMQLRDAAELFILDNFRIIVESGEFHRLPLDVLMRFLRSDDLNIDAEHEVLYGALHWLDADAATRRCCVYDVTAAVRFSLIPKSLCEQLVAAVEDLGIKIAVQKLVQDVQSVTCGHARLMAQLRRRARRTVYVVGGYCRNVGARWSDSATLSRVDGFETYLRVWRSVPSLHSPRSGVAVATLNGTVYAIGGESDSLISDGVEFFDPVNSTRWQTTGSLTVPRCSAGACAVNDQLYVFGGWIGAEIGRSIECYDLSTRAWTAIDSYGGTPRYAMGVSQHDGLVYVIGGLNEMNAELNTVDVYNPATQHWKKARDMQMKRAYLGVTILSDHIYAVGGWTDEEGAVATVEKYSVTQDEWVTVSPMLTARAGLSAIAVNGFLYVFGGRTSSSEFSPPVTLASVECYDPELDEWREEGQMPTGRCEAGITVL